MEQFIEKLNAPYKTENFRWSSEEKIVVIGSDWEKLNKFYQEIANQLRIVNEVLSKIVVENVVDGRIEGELLELTEDGKETGKVLLDSNEYREFLKQTREVKDPKEFLESK